MQEWFIPEPLLLKDRYPGEKTGSAPRAPVFSSFLRLEEAA